MSAYLVNFHELYLTHDHLKTFNTHFVTYINLYFVIRNQLVWETLRKIKGKMFLFPFCISSPLPKIDC